MSSRPSDAMFTAVAMVPGPRVDVGVQEDFLAALARELEVRAVVLVPTARSSRWWWLADGVADPVEVQRLSDLGRAWLERLTAPEPASGAGGDDNTVTIGELRAADGRLLGALLGAKPPGRQWTGAERSLFDFTSSYFRDELAALADRPRPHPIIAAAENRVVSGHFERRMRTAAERGELTLLYQPEIDMRTGDVVAVEALMRWDHPERGRLGPDTFIGVAERSDLIKILGAWVIERALHEYASWRGVVRDSVVLRINVSPAQLAGDGVVGQLGAALHDTGVRGDQLCIEFTETSISGDIEDLSLTLRALSDMGIGTAIDDLATGYSTLSRLRLLPVDTIKIDRSLVSGIDEDERARAIVASLIRMAADLHLEVVGEGIENEREARALLALGCHRGQGHHFARPEAGDAIRDLLRTGRIAVNGLGDGTSTD